MAKEQKRGNREIRKPKTKKAAAPAPDSTLSIKGMLGPAAPAKKKG